MKRILAVAGLATAMLVSGCQNADDTETTEAALADEPPAVEGRAAQAPAASDAATPAAAPAAPGAPIFAVLYPGATPKGPATAGQSPAGPGGMLEFTTEATPDEVVAFYRDRAEASGLKPITTLNREDARAYSAGDGADGTGKLLNVIATPVDGATDVLLTWSNGR
ncbi:hypothetical protein GCM10009422_29790 [Brevundimonas kwangchunensis]|uniref:Lipoprotein n=1 Tax=Brevundimonas kwangchunensis TaxID=322163 RepID=A0ABP3SAJ6_9CAUL